MAEDSVLQDSAGFCFLCGGTSAPIVVSESSYHGRACSCGLVYIDPLPRPGTVNVAVDRHPQTYYSLPARLRLDWVSRFQPSGCLLEVGCGTGEFLALAKARGYRVSGVEPNTIAARIASESLGIEVEEAMIENTTLPDQSYDVVFHVDLLSHFPDPVRALRKMAKLLRPNGLLCFEVGVFGGLSPWWYPWVGRVGYPHHLWLYSEASVTTTLERAGLRIEALRRFALLPGTLLSTLGNHTLRSKITRPHDVSGRAPRAAGFYLFYSWLHYILKYRVGAFLPPLGPFSLFVAARRLRRP